MNSVPLERNEFRSTMMPCAAIACLCLLTEIGRVDLHAAQFPGDEAIPVDGQGATVTDAESARLSAEETEQTVRAIRFAGGIVLRNASGQITGVDVARGRTPVGEETARALLRLPRLQVLRLAVNEISTETLSKLASHDQLNELMLRDVPISDAQLDHLLDSLSSLERLTLRRLNLISDSGLDGVVALPKLKVLGLIEMRISHVGLAKLPKLAALRSLDLRDCGGLAGDDYRALLAMKQLKGVKLGGPGVNDAVLKVVAAVPSLQSLSVEDASVSADGVKGLADRRALAARMRSLTFTRCYGVNDDALSRLSSLPRLETVSIRECPVSGKFLTQLAESAPPNLPKLKTLVVTGAFLSPEAIAVLPRFAASLNRLDLSGVTLSSDDMRSVAELRQLQTLRLSDCSLDDKAVEALRTLKKITTLDLSGNYDITDASAGILDALPRLEHVNTANTGLGVRD